VEEEEEEEEGEGEGEGKMKRGREEGGVEGGREERRVQWRGVIDDLALFDEREMVGVIHRESEHGLKGMEGVTVLELRRRQVRREGGREGRGEGKGMWNGLVTITYSSLFFFLLCACLCVLPPFAVLCACPLLSTLLPPSFPPSLPSFCFCYFSFLLFKTPERTEKKRGTSSSRATLLPPNGASGTERIQGAERTPA